jgi:hypothetical protein
MLSLPHLGKTTIKNANINRECPEGPFTTFSRLVDRATEATLPGARTPQGY